MTIGLHDIVAKVYCATVSISSSSFSLEADRDCAEFEAK